VSDIETDRLLLRIPESADAAPLLRIHEDPEAIGRVQMTAPPGGLVTAWRNVAYMVGHWHLRGFGEWSVVERATGEVIGRVGFNYPDGAETVALGWIIRTDRWGRRFASEAAQAALGWIWPNTSLSLVTSTIAADNIASIRIAEHLGGVKCDRMTTEDKNSVMYQYTRPL